MTGAGSLADVTAVVVAGALALVTLAPGVERRLPAAVGTNHRGVRVRTVLGWGIAAAVPAVVAAAAVEAAGGRPVAWGPTWALAAGSVLVAAAGAVDDRHPAGIHGIRRHVAALGRGKVTTGIAKLLAAVAAAAVFVLSTHPGAARLLLGVGVLAGMSNALNVLDVAPGRALKIGLLADAALLVARDSVVPWAVAGCGLALLWPDLSERAMLGDQGSTLLGFLLGAGLYERLSVPGLGVALGAIVLFHVAGETIEPSRLIAAVPPLRWLDRLGRLPPPSGAERGGESPPSTGS